MNINRATKKVLRDAARKINRIVQEIKEQENIEKAKLPVFEGRKNECIDNFFAELCCLTKEELKSVLPVFLKNRDYDDVIVEDGFIYAKGDVPILLTAHMDTVHDEAVIDYYEKLDDDGSHIIYSPQGIGGDDRCGIYAILRIIETKKCSVLFCEDEEIGCVGSKKFCKTDYINEISNCKYIIELDRKGNTDAVFYSCDNPDFTKFILDNTEFEERYGSYSDISYLAPEAGIAAVNLSCGYYKPHTKEEYVVLEELYYTINTVRKLVDVECDGFEYKEIIEDDWDDFKKYYADYYGCSYQSNKNMMGICAEFKVGDDEACIVYGEGYSEMECWGNIFFDNPELCFSQVVDYEQY